MISKYNYISNINGNKDIVYLILHGVNKGMESSFIQDIYTSLKDKNVYAMNFKYIDEDNKPSEELVDEARQVKEFVDFFKKEGYEKIILIGKSMGGLAVNRMFEYYNDDFSNIIFIVLGLVKESYRISYGKDNLKLIIQGEFDRYGNGNEIYEFLKDEAKDCEVIEIEDADHSYRGVNTERNHEKEAIDSLNKWIEERI